MHTQEKERIIKAINDLGRKVSVADVSAKTGLPLLVVSSKLNEVAAETNGHLQVSTAGDIAYRFDFGFQSAYLARGINHLFQTCAQQFFRIGFFLLRISFGIMLIVSLAIIVLLFIAVMFSLSRGDSDSDDRGFNFDFFDYLILRDLFCWNPYYSSSNYQGYNRPAIGSQKRGNFLFNCFSFLFGDGNPNRQLENERWQLVAQVIRKHGGVVTAEQLAPYTDANPSNEDGVLPVLVRFDGRPEVTETGNIVYTFPSLQVSSAGAGESSLPSQIQERRWAFSNLPTDDLIPVVFLAIVNFLGSLWLYAESQRILLLQHYAVLLSILGIYGSLFVLVPFVRWVVISFLNAGIKARNEKRQEVVLAMAHPSAQLSNKLLETAQFKTKLKQLSDQDVVYTTDKDLLEQTFEAQEKKLSTKEPKLEMHEGGHSS